MWCVCVCDPMDYTFHGILQARMLEWVAFPFSRGSSQLMDWTQLSHITGGFFTSWAKSWLDKCLKKKKKKREVRHSNLWVLHLCCHTDFHLVPGATLSSLSKRENSELSFFLIPCSRKDFLHQPLHIVSSFSYHSHCSLLLNYFLFMCFSRGAI